MAERERQKKWREEHRGYERLRAKNVRERRASGIGSDVGGGALRATGSGPWTERAAVSESEEVPFDSGSSVGRSDERIAGDEGEAGAVGEGDSGDGDLEYVDLEGVDKPYADYERRMAALRRRRGWRLMEPEQRGGHGNAEGMGEVGERGVSAAGASGQKETANEKATYAKLEEFKRKRGQRERKGVKVDLKC